PVGKIFKPALRWKAIQKGYQSELKVLEDLITSFDVTVTEDKIHGSMVAIAVKAAADISHDQIRERVSDALARYTVKYRLEIN
ncbi:MAG: acyl-CoA synthetase, partial [Desulfobacterales bacterium]